MSAKTAQKGTLEQVGRPVGTGWELDDVRTAVLGIDEAREDLVATVAAARAAQFTWREIGVALGTTAQSAHERFGQRRRRS